MRLVLDCPRPHRIPPETGFMRGYSALRFTPFKHSGRDWTARLGWTRDPSSTRSPASSTTASSCATPSSTASVAGARRRRCTPGTSRTWPVVFPDAQFVGVIRHPYAQHRLQRGALLARGCARAACARGRYPPRSWSARRRRAARALRDPPLRGPACCGPSRVLRELLEWLGEPWSAGGARAPRGAGPARRQAQGRGPQPRPTTRSTRRASASGRRRRSPSTGSGSTSGSAARRALPLCARGRRGARAGHRERTRAVERRRARGADRAIPRARLREGGARALTTSPTTRAS